MAMSRAQRKEETRQRSSPQTMWDATLRPIRVSIVIPALNEEGNLPHVLPRIPSWVEEVLLVDGHSTDGTVDVARRLRPDVRIVQQEGKGKGAALRSGFNAATGDVIVMLDADGSTDPAEIPGFIGALLAGADFVKGSRFLQGAGTEDMPWYRRFGNLSFVLLARWLFRCRYSDLCYGYNAFWSDVLPQLQLDSDGFEIETTMNLRALRAGLRVVEVSSHEAPRIHGNGRLRTIPDGWRVLKAIFRERLHDLHVSPILDSDAATGVLTLATDGAPMPPFVAEPPTKTVLIRTETWSPLQKLLSAVTPTAGDSTMAIGHREEQAQ